MNKITITVTQHSIERFKARVFWKNPLKNEDKIIKFLQKGVLEGKIVNKSSNGAKIKKFQGVYFVVKNNAVITVLGDKRFRHWSAKQNRPRYLTKN